MRGIDYSFSRPDINCLWRSGQRFVVRYTSNGNSSKNASKAEIDALKAKGFKVVIVHQNGVGDMLQGADKGRLDAQYAKSKTEALGMPNNRPIYFALDQDPEPLSLGQLNTCRSYLDGAASVIGRNRVGVYAGYRGIEAFCPQWAPWGWQTYAWSGGRISSKAHFRQYRNGVHLCGGDVDLNETYQPDFGQWPHEEDDMFTPETEEWLDRELGTIRSKVEAVYNQGNRQTGLLYNEIRRLGGKIPDDVDEAEIAHLVLSELDADAIAAAIPAELASQVADELAQRLAG